MTASDWARPVVYFEIRARDIEVLAPFYKELFNWNIADEGFRQIPAGIGGPENGIGGHMREAKTTGVTLYIQVKSLTESLEKARALGATVTMEHMQIPGGATLAAIVDPEGNPITLVQQ
jgi:predicted enzyme related to lactoylglutathione lyase